MAYRLSFVFSFPTGKDCHFPPPMSLVYGKAKEHPSLILSELPPLVGFHLPNHIAGLRYNYRLDPPRWENGDNWAYKEFYTLLDNDKDSVLLGWMEAAPDGVAKLNGLPILHLETV